MKGFNYLESINFFPLILFDVPLIDYFLLVFNISILSETALFKDFIVRIRNVIHIKIEFFIE